MIKKREKVGKKRIKKMVKKQKKGSETNEF